MSDKELRELDAWIAEHVMGWKRSKKPFGLSVGKDFCFNGSEILICYHSNRLRTFSPTDKSEDAMEVFKKCAERGMVTVTLSPKPRVWGVDGARCLSVADTLELAICLFSKKLFS